MQSQSKAVIFARVSSKAQEEEGYSLDSQLKLLRSYCKKRRLTVVKEFKIAETASKAQRRVVFRELLAYITKNRIYHFAVEKTDRAARNIKDAADIYDWIEGDEKRMLHCVKEGLELHKRSTSQVKFMWGIFVTFAKQYTDSLREEAMKGWDEKLAQGWLPAVPPPGYKTISENGKKIHVPDMDVAPLMERVFVFAKLPDHNVRSVTKVMADMGITSRKGRAYAPSYVHKILTNPFYIGINRFNGKEYPGAQEPIISRELFHEVQEKLRRPRMRVKKHNPVFKGMIRCLDCGSVVTWQEQKGRYYGACKRTNESCKGPMLREDRVESVIIQKLENINDPKDHVVMKLKAALQSAQAHNVGAYRQKVIEELNAKLHRMKRMGENLYDDRLADFISKEQYEHKCKQIATQMAGLSERLAMLQEAQNVNRLLKQEPLSDNPIIDLYLRSIPSQKRTILSILFKTLHVEKGVLK